MAERDFAHGSPDENTSAEVLDNTASVKVWDISIRIFHWSIVALVPALYFTAKEGGGAMEYHAAMGYLMLWLMIFRLMWGFFGTRYARFTDFLYKPKDISKYLMSILRKPHQFYLGHNPVGGISVLVIIALLTVQVVTGLFSNDDVLLEGPLAVMVSEGMSGTLTWVHKESFYILLYVLTLHMGAILFYRFYLHSNLVTPMITGKKKIAKGGLSPARSARSSYALLVWAISATITLFILYLPDLMQSLQ